MTTSAEPAKPNPNPWTATLAVVLALLWMAVLAVLLTPEIPDGHGFQHSTISTMHQGGDGARRHEDLLVVGWVFGSVLIAMFVSLLACGMARHHAASNLRIALFLIGGLLYEGVFGMVCYSYRESLAEPKSAFSGAFPEPLSWMLYGIWLIPGFFIVLYVIFFHRWVWPPESEQRFAELLDRSSQERAPE